jgi:outer membrane protein assembly factor BamB
MNFSKNRVLNIVTLLFLFSLVGTIVFSFVGSSSITVNAQTSTVPSNLLQYEWLGIQVSGNSAHFVGGPAPNTSNVLWQKSVTGVGGNPVAFNGMLFITQRSNIVAFDPNTGNIIYNVTVPAVVSNRSASVSTIMKIDQTHMAVISATASVVNANQTLPAVWTMRGFNIADGSLLWTMPNQIGPTSPGAVVYDSKTKMVIVAVGNETGRGGTQNPGALQAWKLFDPNQPPTKAWTYIADGAPYTDVIVDDGKIFSGSTLNHEFCLDVATGNLLWDTLLTGSPFYKGSYYNGVYFGALDNTFYALDANTGNILWQNRPSPYGFWCSGTAAAYGMIYMTNVDGYFYAFNATTGNIVWKYLGPGQYYPGYTDIADGKVYAVTGQGVASPLTGQGQKEFTCFNATTGEVLWQVTKEFNSGPTSNQLVAFGNFYGIDTITDPPGASTRVSPAPKTLDVILYCYGGVAAPVDWTMYGKDSAHTAVSSDSVSLNLAQKWVFHTNGAIVSSPAVVGGKVYVGSEDRNWYCIDAQTGSKIWNFTTNYYIRSSPAVAYGKVYTGADDGFVYCLDANTGSQLWKTPAPGQVIPIMTGSYPEWRSSPNIVGNYVIVGSLDGKLYCLNANSGSVIWTIQTTGAIMCNPTYIAGDGVYFASVDGFVYKVNADSGSVIWNVSTPIGLDIAMEGSACVGNGMVVIGSGAAKNAPAQRGQMYCFNATTGERLWIYNQQSYNATTPNLQPVWTPLYLNHKTLGPVFYFSDFFHFTCVNATNGKLIWTTYLTREHFGLPAYADNKIFMPADTFGIYVCDATTGAKLAYFDAGAQVRSSPAIYDSKVYFGSNSWNVYCFAQASAGTTYIGNPLPSPSLSPIVQPTASPIPVATPAPTTTPIVTPIPTTVPPTASPSATAPTAGISTETLLIAGAAVVIIIVVIAAALVLRKRK